MWLCDSARAPVRHQRSGHASGCCRRVEHWRQHGSRCWRRQHAARGHVGRRGRRALSEPCNTMMPDAFRRRSDGSQPSGTPCSPDFTASLNGAPLPSSLRPARAVTARPVAAKAVYPSTRGDMAFSDFTALVRGGRVATDPITTASGKQIMPRMPAFSTTRVTDEELLAIYNYRKAPLDPNQQPGSYCLARPEDTFMDFRTRRSATRTRAAWKAWRTPGAVDGNACVLLPRPRTPSSLPPRSATTDRPDLINRTQRVTAARGSKHRRRRDRHGSRAARQVSRSPSLRIQPWHVRFQPGGEPLPGATRRPSATGAFGQELKDMGY